MKIKIEPYFLESEEQRLERIVEAMKNVTHLEYPDEREKLLDKEATAYLQMLSRKYDIGEWR